ncbi:MAG: hypothetical protein ACM3YE_10845 [Bacteroidota bacterium]
MLEFFPFETKYCYLIDGDQDQYVNKLKEGLEYVRGYEGSVNSWGFNYIRKKSFFFKNDFRTSVSGVFIKREQDLFFILTFYMSDYIKVISIIFGVISLLVSLISLLYRNYELAPLFIYFLGVIFLGKVFTYCLDEIDFIDRVESILGYPNRRKCRELKI